MQTYESLKHTTWGCKYHVVFIPKCRSKAKHILLNFKFFLCKPDFSRY
jgi:putative transposase